MTKTEILNELELETKLKYLKSKIKINSEKSKMYLILTTLFFVFYICQLSIQNIVVNIGFSEYIYTLSLYFVFGVFISSVFTTFQYYKVAKDSFKRYNHLLNNK